VHFCEQQGAHVGVQLAHAGRKASTSPPWLTRENVPPQRGGWLPVWSASAIPFDAESLVPEALDEAGIAETVAAFAAAAQRSLAAGCTVVELHAAHGYLFHQFLSPLSNTRSDRFGGSFENRTRFLLDATDAVRKVWPERLPLLVRISATDWIEGGWDIEQSIELARLLHTRGVDVIDVSSGGTSPHAQIPLGPGYQVPFAARIRREAGIPTGAVGMITEAAQAQTILTDGDADLIFVARELLRDPYWPLHAARELGVDIAWPKQYLRAKPPLPALAQR
jgi:2,4-dienoyl-CoA reductase-like NADH-dependent reductase (Old Yellow Enzyme family)